MSAVTEAPPTDITVGLSEPGRVLLKAIEALDRPFGLERSAKLTASGINLDRFLATFHKETLPGGQRRGLERTARNIGLGEDGIACLLQRIADADLVHFGHEGGQTPVRKIYLEFAGRVRAALSGGQTEDILVYESLKWKPGEGGRALKTRYTWPAAMRDVEAIESHFASLAGGGQPSARMTLEIIRLARVRGCSNLFYLEVTEEGTQRRSYDVNFYAAGLSVADIQPALNQLAQEYGIGQAALQPFAGRATAALGHISGGFDRNGRNFTTVYFGVEAREGSGRG